MAEAAMSTTTATPVDYDALAAQARQAVPSPPSTPTPVPVPVRRPATIDYDALAAQARQAKPAPAPTVPTPAPVTPGASLSAITPQSLTANPRGEGTYKMIGQDGHPVQIPYSKIRGYDDPYSKTAQTFQSMANLGYHFASEDEQKRFLKDLAADPVYGHEGYGNGLVGWLHAGGSDLTVGALREGAKSITMLSALANKAANKISTTLTGHPLNIDTETELDRRIKSFAGTDPRTAKEKIGGLIENVAEIAIPESIVGKAARATKAGEAAVAALDTAQKIAPTATKVAKVAGEAAKAGGEMGAQQLVKSGGDVDQAKEAALMGAATGGASVAATELVPAAGQFARNILRHRMGVDEFETEKLVQATQEANQKIDQQAAKVAAGNAAEVEKYQKQLQDLKDKHAEEMSALKTDKLTALQKDKEAQAAAQLASAQEKQVRGQAEAVEAKRQNLTDAAEKVRAEVQQRLQNIRNSSVQYFKQAYGDLEKAAGAKGVPYATLADGVHDALDKVKGSAESTKVFKDILARTKGIEEAQSAAGFELEDLANLAPDERQRLMEHLGEEGSPEAAGASLAHLNGYYSELGRALNSPSTPGDVKQAISSLRDFIDKKVKEELGPELYAKNQQVRAQYRRYAEGWKEYAGPAGSGSPVAMSLQAKDSYNATRPFMGMAKEEADRARGIIVGAPGDPAERFTKERIPERFVASVDENGKPILTADGKLTPAWRYRKQTAQMVEHLRNLEGGLKALPKPGSFDGDIAKASAAREKALSESADKSLQAQKAGTELKNAPGEPSPPPAPTPTPAPSPQTLTPQQLREAKAQALHVAAHNLGKFGLWVGIGGLAGGVGTFLKTGDLKKSMEIAAGGVTAGLLTPYMAAKMLDQPGVVKALTNLSRRDLDQLMKLPPQQRGDVEGTIKELADEAVRSGRVKAAQVPWYRVIGGELGRKTLEKPQQGAGVAGTSTTPSAETQNLPTPALPNLNQIDQNLQGGPR